MSKKKNKCEEKLAVILNLNKSKGKKKTGKLIYGLFR